MSKELKRQLKELKKHHGQINPDASWVSSNRANLLSQISNTVDTKISHSSFSQKIDELFTVFAPQKLMQVSRPFIVAFLAVSMTVGGWVAGADAAYKALPGDTMYGVKIAAEKTKVALATAAGDDEVVIQLHLAFAETRSKEVKKMVQQKTPKSSILAGETMNKLKDSLETANQQVKTIGETDNAKAVVLAKDIGKKTAEISKTLQEVSEIAIEDLKNPDKQLKISVDKDVVVSEKEKKEIKEGEDEAIEIKKKIVEEVAKTKKVVNQTGLEVLQRVVQKTIQNGDDSISEKDKKDIVELVNDKITVLSQEVKGLQKEAKENLDILKLSKDAQVIKRVATSTNANISKEDVTDKKIQEQNKDDEDKKIEESLIEGPKKEDGNDVEPSKENVQDETSSIEIKQQDNRDQIQKAIQGEEDVQDSSSKVDTIIQGVEQMDTLEQLLKAIEKTQEANNAHDEVIKQVEDKKEKLQELVQEIQGEIEEKRIPQEVRVEEVIEEIQPPEQTQREVIEPVEESTQLRPTQ